jgi:hypothetical protein
MGLPIEFESKISWVLQKVNMALTYKVRYFIYIYRRSRCIEFGDDRFIEIDYIKFKIELNWSS